MVKSAYDKYLRPAGKLNGQRKTLASSYQTISVKITKLSSESRII